MISRGRVTEQQARDLFEKVDADKSGVIEYDEFKQVRQCTAKGVTHKVARDGACHGHKCVPGARCRR